MDDIDQIEVAKTKKKSKLKNKQVDFDGITFPSIMERDYYIFLLTTYSKQDIKIQPKFVLQPAFVKDNKKHLPIYYIADFQIDNQVYDVKGFLTSDFNLKKKMFNYHYKDLTLNIVTRAPQWAQVDWIDAKLLQSLRTKRKKVKKNDAKNKLQNKPRK